MNDESKSVNCEQTEELKDYHTWSKNNLDLPLCVKEEAVFSPSLVIKNTLTGESWPFYDNYTIQDCIAIFLIVSSAVEPNYLGFETSAFIWLYVIATICNDEKGYQRCLAEF